MWLCVGHDRSALVAEEVATNAGAWERGGYWSLDKRSSDVPHIASRWEATRGAFEDVHPVASSDGLRRLGQALSSLAGEVDGALAAAPGRTLLHGDFKAANLFFVGSGVTCVDFQWIGEALVAFTTKLAAHCLRLSGDRLTPQRAGAEPSRGACRERTGRI